MTIEELQAIIDMNAEAAEGGCHQAQGQVIEAQAEIERLEHEAEEATRDEWCEGAGVPPDPFTEARKAQRIAQEEADRLFWQEQEQVSDDLPEEPIPDWGHHDQWGHDQG